MKKMRRQLLSGLCATALVVGMMPGAIWASDAVTTRGMVARVCSIAWKAVRKQRMQDFLMFLQTPSMRTL